MKKFINAVPISLALYLITIIGLGFAFAQQKYPANQNTQVKNDNNGLQLGSGTNQRVAFYGATPIPQPAGSAQAALSLSYASGTFTFVNNPAPMVFASSTLTLNVPPSAGDYMLLGSGSYNFVTSISGTPSANEILINTSLPAQIQNILGAINYWSSAGQGQGVTYFDTGSAANASALAVPTGTGGNQLTAYALAVGTSGNGVVSGGSFTSGSNSWSSGTFTGGVAGDTITTGSQTYIFSQFVGRPTIANLVQVVSGTTPADIAATIMNLQDAINGGYSETLPGPLEYSAATVPNPLVTALSGSTTLVVTSQLSGTAPNAYALALTGTNITKSGTVMAGGAAASFNDSTASLINAMRNALVKEGLLKGSQ